jgi:PKD repeat protein
LKSLTNQKKEHMKKNLLKGMLCIIAGGLAVNASAQENAVPFKTLAPSHLDASSMRTSSSTVSAAGVNMCGPDTILYPYLKELVFASPNDSFFIDAMVGNVRTATQAYHVTDNVNILGVQFWGWAYSTNPNFVQTMPVRVYLYAVNAMNMPTTVLDSTLVTVTGTQDFYEATFALPYTTNQNFAVGVKSQLSDTLAIVTNNAGNVWTPNYGEGLAWRRFGSGTWNAAASFFGQDLEYMIFPIVDYSATASFTGPTMACVNTTATFTNTSSSIYGDRMFNLLAFDEYWGFAAADSTFTWNYGDGPGWTTSMNGSHTYTAAGTYDVMLAGEMIGYYTSCSDTMMQSITVMEPTASFTYDDTQSPMVSFTNTSTTTGTTPSYAWDFGDSNTSTATDPTHTYGADGTYTVTLTVTDSCGTDTDSQVITITTVGIEQVTALEIKAFFNASEQSLNVTVPAKDAVITVYDMLGQVIHSAKANASTEVIGMSGAAAGTYMVRVNTANATGTAKFVVIK